MAEVLEMEARLKNFISQNLDKIKSDLKATESTAQSAFRKMDSHASNFGKTIVTSMIGATAIIGTFRKAMQLLIQTMNESVDLYKVQVDAEAKLNAIIVSTGQAAGFTADELFKMAAELQKVTTFGDEAVIGAQALLATFTKIGNITIGK